VDRVNVGEADVGCIAPPVPASREEDLAKLWGRSSNQTFKKASQLLVVSSEVVRLITGTMRSL
jgi:hypothetical protein